MLENINDDHKLKIKNIEQGVQVIKTSIWIYPDISAGAVMFKICSTTQEEIDRKIKTAKLRYTFWKILLCDSDQKNQVFHCNTSMCW